MKQTLLKFGAGPLQPPANTMGELLGLRVVAADGDLNAPGLGLANRVHIVAPRVCLGVVREEQSDEILHICSEVAMVSMALINGGHSLRSPVPEMAVRVTDREQRCRAFEGGGAPSPKSIVVTATEATLAAAKSIGGA